MHTTWDVNQAVLLTAIVTSMQCFSFFQANSEQDAPMDLSKSSSDTPSCMDSSRASSMSMFPPIKAEPPTFDFHYYRQDSPSLYGGMHSMIPFHPSIKTEMNRGSYGSPEPPDVKSNDVSKDAAPIPQGSLA